MVLTPSVWALLMGYNLSIYLSRPSLVMKVRTPYIRESKAEEREGKKREGTEEKRRSRVINDEFSLLELATSDSQSFDHSNGDQTKKLVVAASKNDPIIPIFRGFFFFSQTSKVQCRMRTVPFTKCVIQTSLPSKLERRTGRQVRTPP
jgi:hypothetical protein